MMNNVGILAVCILLLAISAEAARKKQRAQAKRHLEVELTASKLQGRGSEEFITKPDKGTCKTAKLQSVCKCNKWSLGAWGYLCSECKDNTKWGWGCSLTCPEECPRGCDFSGNCIPDPDAPPIPETCKYNKRIAEPKRTDPSVTWNERNECQACKRPFYGIMCEHRCPEKCALTAEGFCGRGGECYECQAGYYGETCSEQCSAGCPTCVMVDGFVKDEDNPGQFYPQGYCNVECTNDNHGPTCNLACPANCKKFSGKASCAKDTGFCKQCDGRKWHGDKCEVPCSDGCVGGTCDQGSGTCDNGCKEGWWGDACENTCPAGTVGGCDRENGKPSSCGTGAFPSLTDDGTGVCESCPANCKNGVCHEDGTCSEGCLLGHFGDTCEQECEPTCDGPCDGHTTKKTDGHCAACVPGFFGDKCKKKCHATCKTCTQHESLFNSIGADDCTSCPEDTPSMLNDAGECVCIEGASRKGGPESKCTCDEPADVTKDAFFEVTPTKRCRSICRDGTREVFGDKRSKCMDSQKYKSVIYAEMDGFKQGKCSANEYEIKIIKGDGTDCVAKDYADNIVSF